MGFALAVSPPSGGSVLIAMQGELDAGAVPDLRVAVTAALATRPVRILLDASEVTFADSVALGALVAAYDSARVVGTTLTVIDPGPFLTHLLDVTGLAATLARR